MYKETSSAFCLNFESSFQDFSAAQGGVANVLVAVCAKADGQMYLPDFPVWQLYLLVCICYLSVSTAICSLSLNKQVHNS